MGQLGQLVQLGVRWVLTSLLRLCRRRVHRVHGGVAEAAHQRGERRAEPRGIQHCAVHAGRPRRAQSAGPRPIARGAARGGPCRRAVRLHTRRPSTLS
eukprot:6352556-Pyramimonas_sp.AAC.2